jgi:hypothetical protein
MRYRILALSENTIGAQLLLSTHLEAEGHRVTVLSRPEGLGPRMAAESFDCLILDEAAMGREWRRVMEEVSRCRGRAGIVWLGQPPRGLRIPLDAVFAKPLRYGEIAGFFSRWVPPAGKAAGGDAEGSENGPVRRAKIGSAARDARGTPVSGSLKRARKPWLRKRS